MMCDELARRDGGNIQVTRSGRMMLDPLAEVVIGMFMAIGIGGGQLMMNILRDGKRCQRQQDAHETDRETDSQQTT